MYVKNTCMVTKVAFIIAMVFLTGGKAQAQRKTSGNQPLNILWITCEDMSAHLPSYGDSTIITPNISNLAVEGVRYARVFSVAGVCAPSRAGLITGMYPTSFGANNMRTLQNIAKEVPYYSVVPPPYVKTHSEYLRAAGYYCTNNVKTDYQFETPISAWDECSSEAHWRNRPKDKPFFAIFNFMITHESQIWSRNDEPLLVDPSKIKIPPIYPDTEIVRRDIARNYTNIMRMDEMVGKVLRELREDGLMDNTIIFFYSDHGSGLPFYKREMYDRGLHVPLIIRYPDKAGAGTWNDELISFVDFAPTLLSLAGIPIPGHMQGQAFLGDQKSKTPRRYVFAGRDRMDSEYDIVRAVRDKRYKYIRNYQPDKPLMQDIAYRKNIPMMNEILKLENEGKLNETQRLWFKKTKPAEELYDTETDPFELNNLADKPGYEAKLKELREAHEQWVRDTRDLGFTAERELYLSMWPDGVQPQTKSVEASYDRMSSTVSLACAEPGASIVYKTNPGDKSWQLYTKPFKVPVNSEVKAVSIRYGFKQSGETTMVIP
jgi:arylsulfatase A-like enzyme